LEESGEGAWDDDDDDDDDVDLGVDLRDHEYKQVLG
jgi:hypothetical protein